MNRLFGQVIVGLTDSLKKILIVKFCCLLKCRNKIVQSMVSTFLIYASVSDFTAYLSKFLYSTFKLRKNRDCNLFFDFLVNTPLYYLSISSGFRDDAFAEHLSDLR